MKPPRFRLGNCCCTAMIAGEQIKFSCHAPNLRPAKSSQSAASDGAEGKPNSTILRALPTRSRSHQPIRMLPAIQSPARAPRSRRPQPCRPPKDAPRSGEDTGTLHPPSYHADSSSALWQRLRETTVPGRCACGCFARPAALSRKTTSPKGNRSCVCFVCLLLGWA